MHCVGTIVATQESQGISSTCIIPLHKPKIILVYYLSEQHGLFIAVQQYASLFYD